ncbi:hypothetical protein [Croceitalea rosinachiae]|uniref:Uncharacterized protein n=1 Tax=Croceitalea rosinachiae TaxID=3075596 RepID=A0ABU3ABR7_9FLAO|nr:hypothetical protein [Croceitalea sp. F388]MDT0607265.1 hypothetical protein [Croceitalea sp. F388]
MIPEIFETFKTTLSNIAPEKDWPPALQSLWYAANGQWVSSHNIAQDLNTKIGSWIHTHLHHVEGDKFNAGYWYNQAEKSFCKTSFDDEIKEIVDAFLDSS